MASVKRRRDVRDLLIWSIKSVRKIHRVLIVSISFIRRNSGWELARPARNRRRIREQRDRLLRRTHRKDSEIAVTEIAIVSLPLKIGENLYRPIGIRAQRRPRLNVAVHVPHAV